MTELDDHLFGAVKVDAAAGQVSLAGDAVPEVVLTRAPGVELRKGIPIGTRDAAALTLLVAGEPAVVRPGRGGLMRGSHRVRVRHGGDDLLFTPSSPTTARLVRGRSYRGDNEMGTFERVDGDLLPAVWSTDVSVLGGRFRAGAPIPEPWEAAVGYVLAAAFGTGAQFLLMLMLEGGEQVSGPG